MKKHLMAENHDQDSLQLEVLHHLPKGRKMDRVEGLEIRLDLLTAKKNINIKEDVCPLKFVPTASLPQLAGMKSQSSSKSRQVNIENLR